MLLDNCGDGNTESPATNHPSQRGKNPLFVTLRSESYFFPPVSWVCKLHRYKLARVMRPMVTMRMMSSKLWRRS